MDWNYVYHDIVSLLWTYALHRQDGVGGFKLIPPLVSQATPPISDWGVWLARLIPLVVASSYHVRISVRLIVWAWHIFEGMVSWCPLFRNEFVLESTRWEMDFCRLSGIEKHPLLRGCISTTIMLNPICNMTLVRYREVVFSEGPLSEARLYIKIIQGKA